MWKFRIATFDPTWLTQVVLPVFVAGSVFLFVFCRLLESLSVVSLLLCGSCLLLLLLLWKTSTIWLSFLSIPPVNPICKKYRVIIKNRAENRPLFRCRRLLVADACRGGDRRNPYTNQTFNTNPATCSYDLWGRFCIYSYPKPINKYHAISKTVICYNQLPTFSIRTKDQVYQQLLRR